MIILIGYKGLLGTSFIEEFKRHHIPYEAYDLPELDILNKDILEIRIPNNSLVINCAAYTDVAAAESCLSLSYNINFIGVANLALVCLKKNSHLVHFSTDFVFDGLKMKPYCEEDPTNPLNWYARTKLLGESCVLNTSPIFTVFRLQWLYSRKGDSKSFFYRIIKALEIQNHLSIVSDETGSPCSTEFISEILCKMYLSSGIPKGLYHLSHENSCSRFECAKFLLNKIYSTKSIHPSFTTDTAVKRPKYGVLSVNKLKDIAGLYLGTWEEDLDEFKYSGTI